MRVESNADLMAFFSTDEFAENAIIRTAAGDTPVTGHPDVMSDTDKPGGRKGSTMSPFMSGAAEFTIQEFQFLTQAEIVEAAGTKLDDTLIISTGDQAGTYRIKDINRDGGLCRLLLNLK